MKIVGLKEIAFTKLALPKDFPKRIAGPTAENARTIAESLDQISFFIHDPVVRSVDGRYEVVAGGDRVAAAYLKKQDRVICKVVECDDREAQKIRIIENTHRRFDPTRNDRELEQLEALVRGDIALEVQAGNHESDRPITEARERIAKAKGITAEGVRKAQQRAKARTKKVERSTRTVVEPEEAAEVIKTFGIAVDREWLLKVGELRAQMERAYGALLTCKGAVTRMQTQELPMVGARWTHIKDDADSLAELLRSSIPTSLCPYCKGQEGAQETCVPCVGQGYITEGQEKHVPPELWDAGVYLLDGDLVPIPEPAPPEPKPATKRAEVVESEDPFGDFP